MKMKIILILIIFTIFGCAGSPAQLSKMNSDQIKTVTDRQLIICMQYNGYATDVVFNEAVSRGLIAQDEIDLIKKRMLRIGMSESALLAAKGFGHDVNRTVNKYGVRKQYIYGTEISNRKYVYVENGKVTSWQD